MIKSTRSNLEISSSKAILQGLSSDGGLFVFKDLDKSLFNKTLVDKTYQELALIIMKSLLHDYDESELQEIIEYTYTNRNFSPFCCGVRSYRNHGYLSLFHGNTFAFKDMALSILPSLMSTAKKKHNVKKHTVILTATSGDTGGAALNGFKDSKDTSVIVLYPTQGVSEFQELQMNQYQSESNKVFAVDGNFDDCQNIVKDLFNSQTPNNIDLSSANSINIGRLIPQVIYYFYGYSILVKQGRISFGDEINVSVPTGNFGNIYAANMAKRLGLPIKTFIVASNENNVLTDFFNTGVYRINRELSKTYSPSMDIIISSNLERYLYDLLNQDSAKVKSLMDELKETGEVKVEEVLSQTDFYANYCTEAETLETIKSTLAEDARLVDPHTAVAKKVYDKYVEETKDDTFTLVISTASAYKFSEAICDALDLEKSESLKERFELMSKVSKKRIDKRLFDVLTSKNEKITLSKEEAFSHLEKVIGDIDGRY